MRVHEGIHKVGNDGVLEIQVPLGLDWAGKKVVVTISPTNPQSDEEIAKTDADWRRTLKETYGAGEGLGLERHDQGVFEERDPIE